MNLSAIQLLGAQLARKRPSNREDHDTEPS